MAEHHPRREDRAVTAIDHPRQLMLLAVVAGGLALTDRWRQPLTAIPSFALYGALHSSTLVMALRKPWASWRKASFMAIAASLSMLSVLTALRLNLLLAAQWGVGATAVPLTLASGLGAACYVLLIRLFWIPGLSRRALLWIPLCCALATFVALPCGVYLHTVGARWFAIIWWWAFSLALSHYDGRSCQIEVTHVRHS